MKQGITIRTKVDEQPFLRNSHKRKRMALPPLAAARTHKLDDAAEFTLKRVIFVVVSPVIVETNKKSTRPGSYSQKKLNGRSRILVEVVRRTDSVRSIHEYT